MSIKPEESPDIQILSPASAELLARQDTVNDAFESLYGRSRVIIARVEPGQRRVEQTGFVRTSTATAIPLEGGHLTVQVRDTHFGGILPASRMSVRTCLASNLVTEPQDLPDSLLHANNSMREQVCDDTKYGEMVKSILEIGRMLTMAETSLGLSLARH